MSEADVVIQCSCGMPERDGRPLYLLRYDVTSNTWRLTGDPTEFLETHSGHEKDCNLSFFVDKEFVFDGHK